MRRLTLPFSVAFLIASAAAALSAPGSTKIFEGTSVITAVSSGCDFAVGEQSGIAYRLKVDASDPPDSITMFEGRFSFNAQSSGTLGSLNGPTTTTTTAIGCNLFTFQNGTASSNLTISSFTGGPIAQTANIKIIGTFSDYFSRPVVLSRSKRRSRRIIQSCSSNVSHCEPRVTVAALVMSAGGAQAYPGSTYRFAGSMVVTAATQACTSDLGINVGERARIFYRLKIASTDPGDAISVFSEQAAFTMTSTLSLESLNGASPTITSGVDNGSVTHESIPGSSNLSIVSFTGGPINQTNNLKILGSIDSYFFDANCTLTIRATLTRIQ